MKIEYETVHKAISGDGDAFLIIMQTYKTDLYKTAYSYLRNQEDALEAVQETTYRAYKSIHTVKDAAYLKTWLIRIVINYCNDQLKRKKRVVMSDEFLAQEGSVESHAALELSDAMKDLDERSREILTLKYFHDLKIKEIADSMHRPEGTIKTWLNKALKALREKLEEKGGNFYV